MHMNAAYCWLKLPSKMLLRTGKQLDFLLHRDVPATLITRRREQTPPKPGIQEIVVTGRMECHMYMLYNTPNILYDTANKGMFNGVIDTLESKNRLFYKLQQSPIDISISHGQILDYFGPDDTMYNSREQDIKQHLTKHSTLPYLLIRMPSNGHACMAPMHYGNFTLTTVIREDFEGFSCVGRRPGDPWYYYNALTGVVRLHEEDVRRCINTLTNPTVRPGRTNKKDFRKGWEITLYYQNNFIKTPPTLASGNGLGLEEVSVEELAELLERTGARTNVLGVDGTPTLIPLVDRTFSDTCGITNLGNTCYVSAAMQLFARLDGLEHVEEIDSDIPSFLTEMFLMAGNVIAPSESFITSFARKIDINPNRDPDVLDPKYVSNVIEQVDVSEFVCNVADGAREINRYFMQNVDMATREYNQHTCVKCGQLMIDTQRVSSQHTFTIAIKEKSPELDLQKLINDRQADLLLPGYDERTCGSCGTKQAVRGEKTEIVSLGKYALLQFAKTGSPTSKPVFGFQDPDMFFLTDSDGVRHVFESVAMVLHRGTSTGGHYVAAAKKNRNTIVVYDDERVSGEYASFTDAQIEDTNELLRIHDSYECVFGNPPQVHPNQSILSTSNCSF